MTSTDSYSDLCSRMKEIMLIEGAAGQLGWDTKTYMPKNAIYQRADELSLLSKIYHEHLTSPITGDLLKNSSSLSNLSDNQKRNIELWQREYNKATKIPTELVQKLSKQENITEHIWEDAKKKSNFRLVQPELEKLFDLVKQKATALDPDKPMLDVLLDLYEPKITSQMIDGYFKVLKAGVLKVVKRCADYPNQPDLNILKLPTTLDQQRNISKYLINFIGLDPLRSRIDESEHPFTTGYGDDVRITTHYLDNDPMGSFYSVIHEAGHALYELNLPQEHKWTAIGRSVGLGVHESQSRFVENIIGKSPEFLNFTHTKMQSIIPSFKNLNLDDFVKAVNAVIPSKIRIYADEVTYNLHIILRYEIERDLFEDKITIAELPQVWNERMAEYLGQEIKDDAEGVLQDTHWYGGAFGYFPDYALGNIYDGQFLKIMEKSIPDYKEQLQEGNGSNVLNWLKENIHQKGLLYDPADLVENVTGEKPNSRYFVEYLDKKFGEIYK